MVAQQDFGWLLPGLATLVASAVTELWETAAVDDPFWTG